MKYLLAIAVIAFFNSCAEKKSEEKLEQLDKKSAREVTLKTVTQNDSVLHITNQTIWFNGEKIASKSDTLVTAQSPKTWNATDSTATLGSVPIFVTVQ